MRALLANRFAPITSTAGFCEAPWDVVAEALHRSRRRPRVEKVSLTEPFPEVLHRLEPLTAPLLQRHLILSTASDWTAYFNNWVLGTEAHGVVSYLCRVLECRCLIVTCFPGISSTRAREPATDRYSCVAFQLYGPERTERGHLIRSIRLDADEDGEEFEEAGQAQPFENPARYQAPRIRDRFTPEMLDEYCRALGVRYFDADFYGPYSVLLQAVGRLPSSPQVRVVSLAERQREMGISPDAGVDEPPA